MEINNIANKINKIQERFLTVTQLSKLLKNDKIEKVKNLDELSDSKKANLFSALQYGIQPEKTYIIQHPETFKLYLVNTNSFDILESEMLNDKNQRYIQRNIGLIKINFTEIQPKTTEDFHWWIDFIQADLNSISI